MRFADDDQADLAIKIVLILLAVPTIFASLMGWL